MLIMDLDLFYSTDKNEWIRDSNKICYIRIHYVSVLIWFWQSTVENLHVLPTHGTVLLEKQD
jgi:hypothetical protein